MVVFVGGDDEQRVFRRDAVSREPGKELAKSIVASGQLRDIAGLARPEGHIVDVVVRRVGDVAIN